MIKRLAMLIVIGFGCCNLCVATAEDDFLPIAKAFQLTKGDVLVVMPFDKFIRHAVESNLSVKASGYARAASIYNYESSKGTYDFTLFADSKKTEDQDENSIMEYTAGLSKKIPIGTVISAYTSLRNGDKDTYSMQDPLDPTRIISWTNVYNSDLNLKITHPLLKGGWLIDAHAPVRIAREEMRAAVASDWAELNDVAQSATAIYLDLIYLFQKYQVTRDDLIFSQNLLKLAEEKTKSGLMSGLETLRTKADVLQKIEALVIQEGEIAELQSQIRNLLALDKSIWIIPVETEFDNLSLLEFEKAEKTACKNSGVLLDADARVLAAQLRMKASKWSQLPSLDFESQISQNLYGDSALSSDYDTKNNWYVGVVFQYPLENRTARNAYKSDMQAYQQALIARQEALLAIRENLKKLYERYDTVESLVRSLKERIELAQRRVVIEKEKYLQGVSKLIELRESQNEKVSVEIILKEIEAELNKTKIDVLKTIGILPNYLLPKGVHRTLSRKLYK